MNRALVPLEDRFLARCKPVESGCIEWQAGFLKNRHGKDTYGTFYAEGKMHVAHRWLWKRKKGPVADNIDVCHTCDNTKCVNLDHLFVGTRQQNMDDCMAKGRISHVTRASGSKHGMSKLTEDEVLAIRDLRKQNFTLQALADVYNVTTTTIHRVVNNVHWKNI